MATKYVAMLLAVCLLELIGEQALPKMIEVTGEVRCSRRSIELSLLPLLQIRRL